MTRATRVGVIVGPTASGKSSLAESLVESLDAEIISADALQVYRGLDIGTAKPAPQEQRQYRYHGVDLVDPDDRFTAARFARFARKAIHEINQRGRLALLVGGSGFYVDATLGGLDPLPASDSRWRESLEAVDRRRGTPELHRWLSRLDPERAAAVAPSDRHRILRAVEVILREGRPVADLNTMPNGQQQRTIPATWVGLRWPRAELYSRIDARVGAMIEAGWVAEVESLLESGVKQSAHAMQAIGYRDLVAATQGAVDLEAARERIARDTRRYAKRQMTYFRRRPVTWLDAESASDGEVESLTVRAIEALESP